MLDEHGSVMYLIHRVDDVTDFVREGESLLSTEKAVALWQRIEILETETFLRAQEQHQAIAHLFEANAVLRESEQHLRLATEAGKIGAFDRNLQTGTTVWTPQMEALQGLSPGDFAREHLAWSQLVHPDDRVGAVAKVMEALQTGEPVEGEWRVVWRDGSVHWVSGRFQALASADGKPIRLTGVNLDITERKDAQERLRKMSMHDPLTDLPNRALFTEHSGHVLAGAARMEWQMALLLEDGRRSDQEMKLAHLSRLPFDRIKLEQSLVRQAGTRAGMAAIPRLVIAMGQILKFDVVWEGVESQQTLDALQEAGSGEVQGFLLSRPLPADQFADWCRGHRQLH